jgi:hypothetical protein
LRAIFTAKIAKHINWCDKKAVAELGVKIMWRKIKKLKEVVCVRNLKNVFKRD